MIIKTIFLAAITCLLLAVPLALHRISVILDPLRRKPARNARRNANAHILIVLGSGGHTAEMISMLERAVSDPDPARKLDWSRFKYRTWVVSEGDGISGKRARTFEGLDEDSSNQAGVRVVTVPRARRIHQPLYTAPISSLRCMYAGIMVLLDGSTQGRDFPDIILCDGPATATIMVFASILLRFFDVRGCHSRGKMRTVYVESWARVKRLSLSGMLLEKVVDRFVVQWPQLAETGEGRREYLGVLV
jgi:beta-1,4-N-acetylglucosaminyltransferase